MLAFTLSGAAALLLVSGAVAETSSVWDDKELLPFAAIYNGTLTMAQLTADGTTCIKNDSTPYTAYIGTPEAKQYKSETVTRSMYDPNPIWFSIWDKESKNGTWTWIYSSTGGSNLSAPNGVSGEVYWDIKTTRAGDGLDVSATLVKRGPSSTKANRYNLNGCSKTYWLWKMSPDETWTLTGHIAPDKISLTWRPADWKTGNTMTTWIWGFEGTWDAQSAKLVVGDTTKTEGSNKNFNVSSTAQGSNNSSGSGSGSRKNAADSLGEMRTGTISLAAGFVLLCVFVGFF